MSKDIENQKIKVFVVLFCFFKDHVQERFYVVPVKQQEQKHQHWAPLPLVKVVLKVTFRAHVVTSLAVAS